MGAETIVARPPPSGRQHSDRTHRSLFATAAIVALAALIACWFGTREVTNGVVNYEARGAAQNWALSFSHSFSHSTESLAATPLRPYTAATSPERFKALDNAMFDGQIVSYRLYAPDGVIVASSSFEEIGQTATNPIIGQLTGGLDTHAYITQSHSDGSLSRATWTATALAPLSRGPDTIGIFEVTVDVLERAKQLYRLRYLAFAALAALLASIFGILGFSILRTLSKQHEAQTALALSERQHRQLLDDAPDSMVIHNQREVLYVNEAAVTFHGASSKEELVGIDPIELTPEDKRALVLEYRRRALTEGRIQTTEILGRRRLDGSIIETDSMGIPIEWDGQACILIQSRDMTAQRAAQRELAEREAQARRSQAVAENVQSQLSAFLDNSPSGMYLKDRDRKLLMINRAFEDFYNVRADNLIGKTLSEWRPGPLAEDIDTLEMLVLRNGETMDMEARIPNADGDPRDIVISKFPIFAPNGDIVGIGGVNRDITEIRQQESEVRETQARLATYIDHIPMMVLLLDRESRFLMVNSRFADFFGVDPQKIVGKIGQGQFSNEQHEMFRAENRDICDRQISVSRVIEMRDRSGEKRVIQQTKFPIVTGGDVPVAVGVVQHDITEQKERERDLETARDAAEAANRAKSAFLANMSHEIRTPMNGVFGMADLLAKSSLTRDQQRYLNIIRQSGEALLGVINNVLDVSRVEAGEFQLDVDTFNLHDNIAESVELFTEPAAAKDVFIAHNIAGNVPAWVEGDSVRLRQVLINLLGNAVKFTKEGSIVLRATRIGGNAENALIRFEVSDTGIGIERSKLVDLFKPFHQADSSITRKFGGSGLGLSIAGHIVELMGGRIDVDSRAGEGASFVFSVPMAIDTSKPQSQRPGPQVLSGKRLLIVDDNAINREILTDFARDWKTEFTVVSSAKDAQAAIRDAAMAKTPFDVALIDIVMPQMDGIALAEWISGQDDTPHTKLIGLTSFNWQQDSTISKTAGFCHLATKPIRRNDLANMIADALAGRSASESDVTDTPAPPASVTVFGEFTANVLLAEDNAVNQEIAQEYLTRLGCTVTVVDNGRDAVDRFTESRFDIVLMDVQMPEMDGIEATRRIREIESGRNARQTPIIAATAHAFQEDRDKCIAAGMNDFLSKPYTGKDIEPILHRWLGDDAREDAKMQTSLASEAGASEATPQDTLDSATIEQLRSLDAPGEDRILRKVAQVFVDTTPPQLQRLRNDTADADYAAISLIAHSLKTSAANVAALPLSARFKALEQAARDEDRDTCARLTQEITDMYEEVSTALRNLTGVDVPNQRTG